jgi:ATP/maltotriose-dependent transcriptional regulator MalT
MTGDARAIARVTLSRTVIPALPPGYLSRKHLFSLIDCQTPGTTFVLAPAGYGKTSLVAEWAAAHRDKVIWLTLAEGDSLNEMSAMLIIATRNLIPGFAPWFENEQPIRPTDLVRRWGNELLQAEQDYILVLDNLRQENESDVDIANQRVVIAIEVTWRCYEKVKESR